MIGCPGNLNLGTLSKHCQNPPRGHVGEIKRISLPDTASKDDQYDEFESRAHHVLCMLKSVSFDLITENYQYLPVTADFSHRLSITLYFFCEICKFLNEFKGWYAEIGNFSQINEKICI